MGHAYDSGRVAAVTGWAERAAAATGSAVLRASDVACILEGAARASACASRPAGPVAMLLAGRLLRDGDAAEPADAVAMALRLLDVPAG